MSEMSDFQSMLANISHRRFLNNRLCVSEIYNNCDMERFADRVKEARKKAGMTQKELAAASGLSQTTVSDIERGRNETSVAIVSVARALQVLAEWLAEGKGPRSLDEVINAPESAKPPSPVGNESSPNADLEQMRIEAGAKILAEQASEVASLWMALPPARRTAVLRKLRAEAGGPQAGEARIVTPKRRTPKAPDTKERRGAG